jgi:hypothetical protein
MTSDSKINNRRGFVEIWSSSGCGLAVEASTLCGRDGDAVAWGSTLGVAWFIDPLR